MSLTIIIAAVAVISIIAAFFFGRKTGAEKERGAAAEGQLKDVEKKNEMDEAVDRMPTDAVRTELRRDWQVRPVETDHHG